MSDIQTLLCSYETADKPADAIDVLCRLAHHLRCQGKNRTALIFVHVALERLDVYRIDKTVADSLRARVMEELMIVGYYTDCKKQSLMACEYLILTHEVAPSHRQQALNNHIFFIHPHPSQQNHTRLTIPTSHPYISSSACLVYNSKEDKFEGIVRGVNYSIDKAFRYTIRDPSGHLRTQNYFIRVDRRGNVEECGEVTFVKSESIIPKLREGTIHGLEDMRVICLDGVWWGLAVDWQHCRHGHGSMLLCRLGSDMREIDFAVPIQYEDHKLQKNWVMYTESTDSRHIYMVYSHSPLTILQVDPCTGVWNVIVNKFDNKFNMDQVRGSANPVMVDGTYLFLVHEVTQKDTRKYFHRWIEYDEKWEITRVSAPFYFTNLFVEFSLSVAYVSDTDRLIVVYSSEDNSTEWIEVDRQDIPWINL